LQTKKIRESERARIETEHSHNSIRSFYVLSIDYAIDNCT
jgi:hypothetical protein